MRKLIVLATAALGLTVPAVASANQYHLRSVKQQYSFAFSKTVWIEAKFKDRNRQDRMVLQLWHSRAGAPGHWQSVFSLPLGKQFTKLGHVWIHATATPARYLLRYQIKHRGRAVASSQGFVVLMNNAPPVPAPPAANPGPPLPTPNSSWVTPPPPTSSSAAEMRSAIKIRTQTRKSVTISSMGDSATVTKAKTVLPSRVTGDATAQFQPLIACGGAVDTNLSGPKILNQAEIDPNILGTGYWAYNVQVYAVNTALTGFVHISDTNYVVGLATIPDGNTITVGGDSSNIGFTDVQNPYNQGWGFAFGVNYYYWNGSQWVYDGWNLPASFQQYALGGGYPQYSSCYLFANVGS